MTSNNHPRFLDPAAIDLAVQVFERALCALASDDCEVGAHRIRRTLAKKIIEDIFEGERDEERLLINALERVNPSSQANVTVLKRPSA